MLTRARDLVDGPLRAAVARLEGDLRLPADYHFGWVEADGTPIDDGAGKGIRPALAVLGAEAAGADASVAVPAAVAVELVHNFSLLHDDIIDDDRERRHRSTVWSQFSVGEAIIVGDALHTLAFQVLLEGLDTTGVRIAEKLGQATAAMIRGQSEDMGFDRRDDVSLDDCLAMEADKTGALLAFAIGSGAVLGGACAELIGGLEEYGVELGLAFQAHDDLLGVWGEPAVTGKAAGNDIRERKRSVPIVSALQAGGERAHRLREVFAEEIIDDDMVAESVALLEAAGARDATIEIARIHLHRALAALDGVTVEQAAAAELADLARFVVDRDH